MLAAERRRGYDTTMNEDYSDSNPALAALYPAHLEAIKARHERALDIAGAAHAVIFSGAPATAFLDQVTLLIRRGRRRGGG